MIEVRAFQAPRSPARTSGALAKGADDGRGCGAGTGGREAAERLRALPEGREPARFRVEREDGETAVGSRREENLARDAPGQSIGGRRHPRGQVAGGPSRNRDLIDVAAVGALVRHDPVDHGDGLAVRREAGAGELEGRIPDRPGGARGAIHDVELGDPVVVGAGALRGLGGEGLAVGRPVIVVDIKVRRRGERDLSGRGVRHGDALGLDLLLDDPGIARVRDEGAGLVRRALDEEEGDGFSVRRPARIVELALDAGQLPGCAPGGRSEPDLDLAGRSRVREKGDPPAVRREHGALFLVRLPVRGGRERPGLSAGDLAHPDPAQPLGAFGVADLLGPRGPDSVGRDRDRVEAAHGVERVEDGVERRR